MPAFKPFPPAPMSHRFLLSLLFAFALHAAIILGLPTPKVDFRVSEAPIALTATLIAKPSDELRAPEVPLEPDAAPLPTESPVSEEAEPAAAPAPPVPPEPQPAPKRESLPVLATEKPSTFSVPQPKEVPALPAAKEEILFSESDLRESALSSPAPESSPFALPTASRELSPDLIRNDALFRSYLDIWAEKIKMIGANLSSDAAGLVRVRVTISPDGGLQELEILSATNPEVLAFARRVVTSAAPFGPPPRGETLVFSRALVFEPR